MRHPHLLTVGLSTPQILLLSQIRKIHSVPENTLETVHKYILVTVLIRESFVEQKMEFKAHSH